MDYKVMGASSKHFCRSEIPLHEYSIQLWSFAGTWVYTIYNRYSIGENKVENNLQVLAHRAG